MDDIFSYEFLIQDRIDKIKSINTQYDLENNSYLSFSGGKDSTVLHYLLDLALPNNRIPRVFINTGIEYNDIVKFVKELASKDDRFIIINSCINIKKMLEKYGYPFKSKEHSCKVGQYQNGSRVNSIIKYKNGGKYGCPKNLMYQYEDDFKIKLSDKCCQNLKKNIIRKWEKKNNLRISITGMRKQEGGQRSNIGCILTDNKGNLKKFHPLLVVDEEWENEFIKHNNIKLCKLYYQPFNFKRTGCKGCPYSLNLQEQLDVMKDQLPNEYKQCEILWGPVYEEYRKIGFRLRNNKFEQLTIYDYIEDKK